MNERCTPEASPDAFDGDATSRSCWTLGANACLRLGRFDEALRRIRIGVLQSRDAGDPPTLIATLDIASEVFLELDRPDTAASVVGYVDGPALGINLLRHSMRDHDMLCAELRAALGDARYQQLTAEGAAMTVDEIAALAVGTVDELVG